MFDTLDVHIEAKEVLMGMRRLGEKRGFAAKDVTMTFPKNGKLLEIDPNRCRTHMKGMLHGIRHIQESCRVQS